MGEQEIISFGKKIKVKIIKVSDEPITRIKKKKVQEKSTRKKKNIKI